jgi:hypothetical protein
MKLYVKLHSGLTASWGLLCDVSKSGPFIVSIRHFPIGELVNLEIFMPDSRIVLLNGVVSGIAELPKRHGKFGIKVELTEKNTTYDHLLKFLAGQNKKSSGKGH